MSNISADQIRKLQFERTKNQYFRENAYARKYVESFMDGIKPEDTISDHEAKRLNGFESLINATRYFLSIGMEPYESPETKGFKDALINATKNNDTTFLKGVKFPYEFANRGLVSTHFDVVDAQKKGRSEKIFISIPNPDYFDDDIKKLLLEDQHSFVNKFSDNGLELINALEEQGYLAEEEAHYLMDDYENNFSVRKIPVKKSTYDKVKTSKMNNLPEGTKPENCTPETMAIGLVFSGVRNHCTIVIDGERIVETPNELETIGVPKGSPPVQFNDGLVQTSSGGVKQTGELLDDTNPKVEAILKTDASYNDKRKMLEDAGAIISQEFSHEYVEYATRAPMAKAEIERGGQTVTDIIPVWKRNGNYYSGLEEDKDKSKTYENGFDAYNKPVKVLEFLKDKDGLPVKVSGFRRDNASNIFLGTAEGKLK